MDDLTQIEDHVNAMLKSYKSELGMSTVIDPTTGATRRELYSKMKFDAQQTVMQKLSSDFNRELVRIGFPKLCG